ncbi:nuclease-related domain-containing protein [Geomicrobium sp. JCM 19055]|uniref:nuclease-related domain-containing protein n=1 Tax=Geomicrobium sp. JCM 19055 TaxID=1460649 RepID=UPI00045ED516|nr:nuclease-related domain-containing protein [Geomicrobium sp. JCM 19055]GAK00220.1 hypothetical protein JCM19055_3300 [Geomicrobium sp. JCM 19055]
MLINETLLQLQALEKRCFDYVPALHSDIEKFKAGLNGEIQLYNLLNAIQLPHWQVLHNKRLPSYEPYYFQLDLIVLTSDTVYLFDTKQMKGHIHFHDDETVTKTSGNETETLNNPIHQVKRHERLFQTFLHQQRITTPITIRPYVVLTSPYTELSYPSRLQEEIQRYVIRAEAIPKLLSNVHDSMTGHRKIAKITSLINTNHRPKWRNVLHDYNLTYANLRLGVPCTQCNHIPVERASNHVRFYCKKCQTYSYDNIQAGLVDYALLINHYCTNKEARQFLNIQDRHTMLRSLQKMSHYTRYTNNKICYRLILPWEQK